VAEEYITQCRFIFRADGLDLGRLATAFALLRLPRMPELRGLGDLPNFTPSSVDPNTVKVRPCASLFRYPSFALLWAFSF
jgi:hypothetical protein